MNSKDIGKELRNHFKQPSYRYQLHNSYIYNWESDFFCINRKLMAFECEIKISRQDFKKDFDKSKKHNVLQEKEYKFRPNKFYYVTPKDLIKLEEIPKYAGLIYIDNNVKIIKRAPLLHSEPFEKWYTICEKLFYRNFDMHNELYGLKKRNKHLEEIETKYYNILKQKAYENDLFNSGWII